MADEKACSIDSPQVVDAPMSTEQVRRVAAQIRRHPGGMPSVVAALRLKADDPLDEMAYSARRYAEVMEQADRYRQVLAQDIERCVGKVPPQYLSAALEVLATGRLTD